MTTMQQQVADLVRKLVDLTSEDCRNEESDPGPHAITRLVVGDEEIGAAPLTPRQLDWLNRILDAELATVRAGRPGQSGECWHCHGTGQATLVAGPDIPPAPSADGAQLWWDHCGNYAVDGPDRTRLYEAPGFGDEVDAAARVGVSEGGHWRMPRYGEPVWDDPAPF